MTDLRGPAVVSHQATCQTNYNLRKPVGGFVCVKKTPDDQRSYMKLQHPGTNKASVECRPPCMTLLLFLDFKFLDFYCRSVTDEASVDAHNNVAHPRVFGCQLTKVLLSHFLKIVLPENEIFPIIFTNIENIF